MYSSKFSSVQLSQVQYQWYKPIWFYLSINREKEEFLFISCWQSVFLSPHFNMDNTQLFSIHPVSTGSHNHPLSIPFYLFSHLFSSRIVARERAWQKADQLYIRPADPEDTTPIPPIYDEHPNLFTRILLQVDKSAILLEKSLPWTSALHTVCRRTVAHILEVLWWGTGIWNILDPWLQDRQMMQMQAPVPDSVKCWEFEKFGLKIFRV